MNGRTSKAPRPKVYHSPAISLLSTGRNPGTAEPTTFKFRVYNNNPTASTRVSFLNPTKTQTLALPAPITLAGGKSQLVTVTVKLPARAPSFGTPLTVPFTIRESGEDYEGVLLLRRTPDSKECKEWSGNVCRKCISPYTFAGATGDGTGWKTLLGIGVCSHMDDSRPVIVTAVTNVRKAGSSSGTMWATVGLTDYPGSSNKIEDGANSRNFPVSYQVSITMTPKNGMVSAQSWMIRCTSAGNTDCTGMGLLRLRRNSG
jgi:hypothetical protein